MAELGARPASPLLRRALARVTRRWRPWLRAVHRDAGYLAVGLTFVYALSGLAINHIGQWDPNFKQIVETHQFAGELPRDEQAASTAVLEQLDLEGPVREAYWDSDSAFQIELDARTLVVDTTTGAISDVSERPRFLLRVANWLHYNRGKAAWTYIADGYAVFLLFLACSGLFMLKGAKGLVGRGVILVTMGIAVPVLYVHFSGGP